MPTKIFDLSGLMISVSGVRGKVGLGLGLEEFLLFSNAFATLMAGRKVVIGRDTRPSGPYLEKILVAALLSRNCDVKLLGVVPTPTVKAAIRLSGAEGGVVLSASHNPMEWNAFKFIGEKGLFFSPIQNKKLMEILESQSFAPIEVFPKGKESFDEGLIEKHLQSVLERVDAQAIRKRKFKVLVDAVNGAGSYVVPLLLKQLGCSVQAVHCKPDGTFPRIPEPTPKALESTSQLMLKSGCDIGFALDPDADRLVLLSPTKGAISEEMTLPLCLMNALDSKRPGSTIVINLSTSSMNELVASEFGAQVIRSKVGEANVVQEMIESKAVFGGEGNGGVIDPELPSYGRDSLAGIAHILELMAHTGGVFDDLVEALPERHMEKRAFPLSRPESLQDLLGRIKDRFPKATLSEKDGLWLSYQESWVHVRPSNTEPIFRVIAESPSESDLFSIMEVLRECAES